MRRFNLARFNLAKLKRQFNLSRWAIARPRIAVGLWVALAIAGLLSFGSLRYALFPDITFPVTVITASAPYDTALQVEALLTDPIEQQLTSLETLENLHSFIYPRQTVISAEFVLGTDLEAAKETVETLLADTYLPPEAEVEVIPFNLNESSAISYALRSRSRPLADLAAAVRQDMVPALEALPGVLRVELLGGQLPDGTPNVLPDSSAATPTLVRFNGDDALAVQVIKQGRANTLDVVERVQQRIAQLQQQWPDVEIELAASQADFIREATQATIESLGLAVILAVAAIILFLRNWRATAIAALTIPLSLMGAFVAMHAFGFNLETITLLALALAVGIVVDDAIVEVENISRYLEKGYSPSKAAIAATAEIGWTVSAATLTIVAVFLPIAFMGGILGQFFKPFGLVVSTAVLTSLLAARTLVPVLAVWWLRPSQNVPPDSPAGDRGFGLWERVMRHYRGLLRRSLNHRGWVLSLAFASLALGLALLPFVPQGFIPKLDRGEFNVAYSINGLRLADEVVSDGTGGVGSDRLPEFEDLPPDIAQYLEDNGLVEQYRESLAASRAGAPLLLPVPPEILLGEAQKVARELEAKVVPFPDVDSVLTLVGYRGEINGGKLRVKLGGDRRLHTSAIQDRLRQSLPQLPNVEIGVEDIQFVDTGDEKPLQLALFGDNLEQLYSTAAEIRRQMAQQPEFADISITGAGSNRSTISEIEHRDAKRVAFVRANLRPGQALGDATEAAVAIAMPLVPEDVTLDLTGDSAAISTVVGSFSRTLALSVACMFIVLLVLFRRWTDPMVVLLSLPLAVVGAALGLLVARSDFGMIAAIGAIFLLGLLDKNAILIVDYTNQLRQRGVPRTEALLTAGPVRLRPILMTAASTILGMLPIALGFGAGAELRSPMAVAIIGGLLTSTALSLVVVPVLYAVLDDWTHCRQQPAKQEG